MAKFRALVAPRVFGSDADPRPWAPTANHIVIRHGEVYETFRRVKSAPGGKVEIEDLPATKELCAELCAAVEKKYGGKFLTFEEPLSLEDAAENRRLIEVGRAAEAKREADAKRAAAKQSG